MLLEKQFTYLKKVKKLVKKGKIEIKNNILIKNIFILLENKLKKGL